MKLRRPSISGFNILELMMSLALITIAALTLVALSFSSLSSQQKSENLTDATLVAREQLSLAIHNIETLSPADHDSFWNVPPTAPLSEGTVQMAETEYNFKIEATDVPVGTVAPNRMRKLDVSVWWWSSEPGEARAGVGQLQYSASSLVREVVNEAP